MQGVFGKKRQGHAFYFSTLLQLNNDIRTDQYIWIDEEKLHRQ